MSTSERTRLLRWFDRHRRPLPWRLDRDPYRIWVSEVMLQQTTVAVVSQRFGLFLKAFPSVHALADAPLSDVLRAWEGLGYYRRARHLHAAAQRIVGHHGGFFPDEPAAAGRLPGVGRYILGAVLSQAFDQRLPIIEANSLRVLSRRFGYRGDPRGPAGQRWLWETAAAILPYKRCGDFNQALMELGALVCTPRDPACGRCPLRQGCAANAHSLQAEIPVRVARPAPVQVVEVAAVIRRGDRILVGRRPEAAGRWAGFWELPHAEMQPGETQTAAARRVARHFAGITAKPGALLATVRHRITRFDVTLHAVELSNPNGSVRPSFHEEFRWLAPAELHGIPAAMPQRKLFRMLEVLIDQRAGQGGAGVLRPARGRHRRRGSRGQ